MQLIANFNKPLVILLLLVAFVGGVAYFIFLVYRLFFRSEVQPRHFWISLTATIFIFIATLVAWAFSDTGVGKETWLYFLALFAACSFLTIRCMKKAFTL